MLALVTTTIYVPRSLQAYLDNAAEHGHRDLMVVIAGDKKTPPETRAFCETLSASSGVPVHFLDVSDQDAYLEKTPELKAHLPWYSVQRRNVAVLWAYEHGADQIITMDDDNLIHEGDYFGHHGVVGTEVEVEAFSSQTGFLNVCDQLTEKSGWPFYHRGFPFSERWKDEAVTTSMRKGICVANAGFWLDAPDIDAVTRMTLPIEVTGYKRDTNFALAPGTWSPFNSQNSAFHRRAVPAYFLSPVTWRYNDIWSGYLVVRIAEHFDEIVQFGHPLVVQERHPHDLWVDLERERVGQQVNEHFLAWLRNTPLSGSSWAECTAELMAGVEKGLSEATDLNPEQREYFNGYLEGQRAWAKAIEVVDSRASSSPRPNTGDGLGS
jgi:hypothetical protein